MLTLPKHHFYEPQQWVSAHAKSTATSYGLFIIQINEGEGDTQVQLFHNDDTEPRGETTLNYRLHIMEGRLMKLLIFGLYSFLIFVVQKYVFSHVHTGCVFWFAYVF